MSKVHVFSRSAVKATGRPWSTALSVNNAIRALAGQRQGVVDLSDERLARSRLAWKMAILRQALTYRLVDLASSTCLEWNHGNALASVALARSTLETCALVEYVANALKQPIEAEDTTAVDAILMDQLFATRHPAWLADGKFPPAKNILTSIKRLDHVIEGAAGHYDMLSEFAHPNGQGTHQFYAETDYETGAVTFSREKRGSAAVYQHVLAAVAGVAWAKQRLGEIDRCVGIISDIQHRKNPVT